MVVYVKDKYSDDNLRKGGFKLLLPHTIIMMGCSTVPAAIVEKRTFIEETKLLVPCVIVQTRVERILLPSSLLTPERCKALKTIPAGTVLLSDWKEKNWKPDSDSEIYTLFMNYGFVRWSEEFRTMDPAERLKRKYRFPTNERDAKKYPPWKNDRSKYW